MGIFILEGPPRSGKSYSAVVDHIIPALKQGRAVVTDIPLKIAELNRITRLDCEDLVFVLQQQYLGRRPFAKIDDLWPEWTRELEGGGIERPLIVVDEAHEVFPADKKGGMTEEIAQWFAMHGHHGFDIVVISQDHMLLSLEIRRRVEMRWKYKKLTALASKMGYAELIFEGQSKTAMAKRMKKYQRRYFPAYKSFTGGGAPSQKTVKPIWANPKTYALGVGIIGSAVYVASQGGVSTSFGGAPEVEPSEVVAPGPAVQSAPAPAPTPPPPAPTLPTGPSAAVRDELQALVDQRLVVQAEADLQLAKLERELANRSRCGYGGGEDRRQEGKRGAGIKAPEVFGGSDDKDKAAEEDKPRQPTRSRCGLEPRPVPTHLLAGTSVKIAAVVGGAGGDPAVWLHVQRGPVVERYRTTELVTAGWSFVLVDSCRLAVRGPWSGVIDCAGVRVPDPRDADRPFREPLVSDGEGA